MRPITAVPALCILSVVHAQPYRMGCRILHEPYRPGPALTALQRTQIDQTIARSDTFRA